MRTRSLFAALALVLALAAHPREASATFIIVNNDGAGEGFNDPTVVAPVGGNPGTTVGQQRLNVFTKAGEIWDAILNSPIPIYVDATFDPLPCSPSSGVLGAAGANVVQTDFANAPYANTWFAGAEANRLAGTNLAPGSSDIVAQFQSDIGTPACLTTRSWYYGYDGNEGANGLDLLAVLLHEFGHGLGFLSMVDESTGDYYAGLPSVWERFLYDNTTGKHWIDMTPGERVASAINTTHLVWDGPMVTMMAPKFLGPEARVTVTGALSASYLSGRGVFSAPITAGGTTGQVVLVNDGSGLTSDGCSTPFTNAGAIAGKIALMDRSGSCSFAQQALNAQNNGAIAAIIINNVAGPEPQLRGAAPTCAIPVASVSQADGNAIRNALLSGTVNATIALNTAQLTAVDNAGRMMMYAPNPDQPGSSVSHWDVSAFPNLLMEPSINPDLGDVDLTTALFYDIGWFPAGTAVEREPGLEVALSASPNPMRDDGELRFRLPESRLVDLTVYDVAGRAVAHLAHGVMSAGDQSVRWARTGDDGRRLSSGVYMVRLKSGAVERAVPVVVVQ